METETRHPAGRARVAILTNIPAPYRLPMFRKLGESTDLKVFFDATSEGNRSWSVPEDLGVAHKIAKAVSIPYWRTRPENGLRDERYLQFNWGILPALRSFRPDVVISAELGPRSLQAALFCSLHKIPLIVWWEGTLHTEGSVTPIKRWVRPRLLRRAARCWVNGIEAEELLVQYGISPSRIDRGLIGIDTAFYSEQTQRLFANRLETRKELDVHGTVFLFVGQLVERKGLRQFLNALEQVEVRGISPEKLSILVVGDGPLKGLLEQWQTSHPGVPLRLVPFQQPDQIPKFYAASDAFVLPTLDDNWSLAALEAAVSGLPQIFSPYNGVTSDLLSSGNFGRSVDPYQTLRFADALCDWIDSPPARLTLATVERLASRFGPDQFSFRAQRSIERVLRLQPSTAAFSFE